MAKRRISITIENNQLQIGLPADVAELVLSHGREILDAIEGALKQELLVNERAVMREQLEKESDERRERHRKLGIQLYRAFRLAAPKGAGERYQVLKHLGEHLDDGIEIGTTYAEHLISRRRRQVLAYLKRRRMTTAFRLYRAGLTNQQIAKHLGVSIPTTLRLLREARSMTQ